RLAQSYIREKDLTDKIEIAYADGIDFPAEQFDFIFIAINVWPIELVLKHLYNNTKPDAKIIYKGIKNDIVELFEKSRLKDLYYIENVAKNQKTYSFLLTKK
ncbi:MAG: hypothetical protein QHH15_07905, partial [Candidatus Thermoplasmatota archaeon]|nr:hypothetical protein [Candidatus Thermoplasmatota archaeon]